jgi:hypothetical protein
MTPPPMMSTSVLLLLVALAMFAFVEIAISMWTTRQVDSMTFTWIVMDAPVRLIAHGVAIGIGWSESSAWQSRGGDQTKLRCYGHR